MLQLEKKIAMKQRFLPFCAVVFRFFPGQNIAFMLQKQPFYMLKAMLLSCNSYAFSG